MRDIGGDVAPAILAGGSTSGFDVAPTAASIATAARMSGHNALTVQYGKAFALGGGGKSRVERHDG